MFSRIVRRRVYKPSDDILQHIPSHDILRQLDRLKRSSPDFPNQLTNLLSGQEYKRPISTDALCDEDRAWLVEYLNNVRVFFSLYPLSTEHA